MDLQTIGVLLIHRNCPPRIVPPRELQKPDRLAYALGVTPSELSRIADDIRLHPHNYNREWSEAKTDDLGNYRLDKHVQPETRDFCESLEPLESIQKSINWRILVGLRLPSNVRGGVRGNDNIANAAAHRGKKHRFKTDLKAFFPSVTF